VIQVRVVGLLLLILIVAVVIWMRAKRTRGD
jgi:hypothetical protein